MLVWVVPPVVVLVPVLVWVVSELVCVPVLTEIWLPVFALM